MKHTLWPSSNQLYWVTTILHQNQREIKVAFCFLALVISQKKMWLCLTILRENKGTGARIVRQDCRASVPFTYPPCVRGTEFLEVLLNFLWSETESQDTTFDESNISWVAMNHAVLLKSHLGYLQWDRKGFQRKAAVNQTPFLNGCLSKAQ